jgi:hypothetical protein
MNPKENKLDDNVNKPISEEKKEVSKPKKVIKILSPFGIIILKK